MLSFGPHKLSPASIKYSKESRWSTIECVSKAPLLQNIGQGVENIDLEGIIYLRNFNGLNQLKNLKETEVPHSLVDNAGNVLGQFVIIQLEEKQTSFFPAGLPRKVEFNISLKRFN
ncbi:phage tail protein [Wolbachia endosymbiont of Pentalonia nigronervosa]|uniref:phage tail protein n=1 Tax=Wolbachia endosymbiont of Pentalonia nigronervosa TaxID=1301914 RepID=UPI00165F6A52|nr:phage tail protein [Wolbachia endosymbiont of Pentalonia nigronervosa]MBD0392036.1 phage tail protein [Wolbachia endosymbiont of Pentalonia nigronervosa]MBD0392258.1 phage tail protein [Wolbachia endosymbiont of Pentalonia nigronervosa]